VIAWHHNSFACLRPSEYGLGRKGVVRGPLPGRPIRGDNPWGVDMALSDQLTKLAARAKEAEDHAAAAQDKAKADLEQDVELARSSAQAQADALRESAAANKGEISEWWNDLEEKWNKAVGNNREKIDSRKDEIDLDRAEKNAEHVEDDASFAIDYAYAAIEEAEYAVLDAALTRKEADELAAGSSA
jgi:hypothetical protein